MEVLVCLLRRFAALLLRQRGEDHRPPRTAVLRLLLVRAGAALKERPSAVMSPSKVYHPEPPGGSVARG